MQRDELAGAAPGQTRVVDRVRREARGSACVLGGEQAVPTYILTLTVYWS